MDYYVFDVPTTKTYSLMLLKDSDYDLRVYLGVANNLNSLTSTTTYTADGSILTINRTLQAGTRYFLRISQLSSTEYDPSVYYNITLS